MVAQALPPGLLKSAFLLSTLLLFATFVMAQSKRPAPVFKPALATIQSRTRIPILLPSKLPDAISAREIKLASGEVREDGYFISLYFSEAAVDAALAAGFGGSTRILDPHDLMNTRRVSLSGGRVGMFSAVSCGGSCAPANLWWEQNGVMYQIQIKLRWGSTERDQEKILIEVANSSVPAQRH
jgi:hypothetical protein